METFFIGHGSPENAIQNNDYTHFLEKIKTTIGKPQAIVVFSAHWLTHGTYITGNDNPEQIYDFYGFADSLYQITYKASGSKRLAEEINSKLPEIMIDYNRGIDHAAWAVLHHMFPVANIPVLEISMNKDLENNEHFKLGRSIRELNLKDVLYIGSGNVIHNLYNVDFSEKTDPYPWAIETNLWIKEQLEKNNIEALLDYKQNMPNWSKAVPTNDHYLPLLYILGMQQSRSCILFNEIQNASISMLSLRSC